MQYVTNNHRYTRNMDTYVEINNDQRCKTRNNWTRMGALFIHRCKRFLRPCVCVCAELQDWKLSPRSIWFPNPTPLSSPSPSIVAASWIVSPPWSSYPSFRGHLYVHWTPPSSKHTHVSLTASYKKRTHGNRKYITNFLSFHTNPIPSRHTVLKALRKGSSMRIPWPGEELKLEGDRGGTGAPVNGPTTCHRLYFCKLLRTHAARTFHRPSTREPAHSSQ